MKIMLSGGGTLGPVMPLLAIREAVRQQYPDAEWLWVGTKNGPEKEIVEKAGMPFFVIGAGKWRRYPSLLNLLDLFTIKVAFFQSLALLVKRRPALLISAGGFVSVPLHWAGWLLGIPAWVHQQDLKAGLANRLMLPLATKITCALQETTAALAPRLVEWTGNPCRDVAAGEREVYACRERLGIPAGAPVILATGGGTGSASINRLMVEALAALPPAWHVVHLTGRLSARQIPPAAAGVYPNYHVSEFLTDEMPAVYRLASVVVGRAGFGTLTELAALGKPAIIIPLPGTHQEDNAHYLAERGAVEMMEEKEASGPKLAQLIQELVNNQEHATSLGVRLSSTLPRATTGRITEIVSELLKK